MRLINIMWLMVIVLINSTILFASPNNFIARTNVPGEFFISLTDTTGNESPPYGKVSLYRATEYGDSFTFLQDSIACIEYHLTQNILAAPNRLSFDEGLTFVEHDVQFYYEIDWVPGTDEIIAMNKYLSVSYDTLQTWNYPFNREDLEGAYYGIDKMRTIGWQPGEYYFSTSFRSTSAALDSIYLYRTIDYGQNFEWISVNSRMTRFTNLYKGYQPGELYVVDECYDSLFVSVDSGRTWQSKELDILLLELPARQVIDLEPGWVPGEFFLIIYNENPYIRTPFYQMYYSSDYGDTFETKYLFLPYYNEVKDHPDPTITDFSVTLYPNPTNGQIRVQTESIPIKEISIYNILGKQIMSRKYPTQTLSVQNISLNHLPSGSYFLKVNDSSGRQQSKKFFIIK